MLLGMLMLGALGDRQPTTGKIIDEDMPTGKIAGPTRPLADDVSPPAEPVKLIFIHHSCGGNWLADIGEHEQAGGLAQTLMTQNYFVSATNYGWSVEGDAIGDRTDIGNWWEWFRGPNSGDYLNALYNEFGQHIGGFGDWTRMADPDPTQENEIIMFKSCYPNSNLQGDPTATPPSIDSNPLRGEPWDGGNHTVANAKGIYIDLLNYFATRQDKLFIVITAPPVQDDTWADNARAFNTWLVNDWLDSYAHKNVAVFDFYNVLTSNGGNYDVNDYGWDTGNHHRVVTTTLPVTIEYITDQGGNVAAYPTGGSDNHPSGAGNRKATGEFVPLLNVYYNRWHGTAPPPEPTLRLTAPNGGESWQVGSQHEIAWASTGTIANISLAYSTDGFGTSTVITSSTPNDGSYTWTVPNDSSTTVRVRVASVVSPTIRDESDANFAIVSGASTESYTFQADITPSNATEPVTYAWSPEPASGQGTARVTYAWAPGTYSISVAATNCGGTFTDAHGVTVGTTVNNLAHGSPKVSDRAAATATFQDGVSPSTSYTGTRDVIVARDDNVAANANLGGLEHLETFFYDEEHRRSLMRWDISSLPSEITVNAASLELYRYGGDAEPPDMEVVLYRLTQTWTEGTGHELQPGSSYVPDGATWLTATEGVAWTTPGGAYDATELDQATLPADFARGWVRLDATAAVRAWVTGSVPNYGLLLRPESGAAYHYFHSRECVTPTLRPRLIVTYTTGTPAPTLQISAPTGDTSWPVSSTQQIQWTATGTITGVNLSYSLGDGFTPIASNVANVVGHNSYDWTTPPTATTSAKVRVESVISPTAVFDVSDAFILTGTVVPSYTVYLPCALRHYPSQAPSCPYPLTGVSIRGPLTQAPPSGDLVQPGDLSYLGAFRLPGGDTPPQTFAYGGNAMTFNPDGDAGNGSLFIMGHDRQADGGLPDGGQVAELRIPEPVDADHVSDLNTAEFIQNFANVAAGYFTELEEQPRTGMTYLNHALTGPKIHISWGQHHEPDTPLPTYAWFNPTLSTPDLQGLWFIGEQNYYSLNGYMFEIPASWADAHAGGRYLGTGRAMDGGWGGMGPSLFAYRPWQADGSPEISGTHLAETTLLLYEDTQVNGDIVRNALEGHQHPDEWEGGAWLTTASGKSAVLFAGNKGTGAKYWYGYRNPAGPEYPCVNAVAAAEFTACRLADGSPCPPEDMEECEGHTSAKGWWCARFEARFILYDPADLAAVAAGTMDSWAPQPYAHVNIGEHLFYNPAGVEVPLLGEGIQRRFLLGGATYDRVNQRLYVLELFADGAKPIAHVWHVG
jgi:hypothetical protein